MDILYASWAEVTYQDVEVTSWVQSLQDRLLTLRECAHSNWAERTSAAFNQGKSSRQLSVGDQVLLRVPGMHGALETSWEGPYKVKEKLSKVNYRITDLKGKRLKVVHINHTKRYTPWLAQVNSICVVAEENEQMSQKKCTLSDEMCDDFDEKLLDGLLNKFKEIFSDTLGLCTVGECIIKIAEGSEVVNKPPHRIPMHLHEAVDAEVQKLQDQGIIVPSTAE